MSLGVSLRLSEDVSTTYAAREAVGRRNAGSWARLRVSHPEALGCRAPLGAGPAPHSAAGSTGPSGPVQHQVQYGALGPGSSHRSFPRAFCYGVVKGNQEKQTQIICTAGSS